jgi:hypothetical protein
MTPTPSSPSEATASPITAPPLKAMRSASPCPDARAASAVRTLALVAAFIPMKPAVIEANAPKKKASAVHIPIAHQRRPPTTSDEDDEHRVLTLQERHGAASIWSAMSRITSLPGECPRT